MSFLKPIVFYLLPLLFLTNAIGQNTHGIITAFKMDSIAIEAGLSFSNDLVIKNTGTQTIQIDSIRPAELLPGILFTPEYAEPLPFNQQQLLKIKMIADNALMRSTVRKIEYYIYYTENATTKISKASFYIVRPASNYLVIGTSSGEAYFNPSISENFINLFVENPGYETKNITLKFQLLPDEFLTTATQQELVSLAPKERKLIQVRLLTRKKNAFYPDYSLSVTAHETGSTQAISGTVIPVRTLAEKRNMNYSGGSNMYKNYLELQFNRSNQTNEFIQFRSNTERKAGSGKMIALNATADYFINYRFLNLYDTWLSFQTPKTFSRVGNINAQGYDMNIAGRGALFQYKITPKTQVEILATNNSFLLYSSGAHLSDPGYSIGTRFNHSVNATTMMNASYVFNQNNFAGVQSHLATVNIPLVNDSIHSLLLEGGASTTEGIHQRKKFPGGALGLSYSLTRKQFSFISNNYFSSPYYAGLRKGALNLYELVRYQFTNSSNIFFLYSGSINKPQFVVDDSSSFLLYQVNNNFTTHQLETGYGRTVNGYTFTLAPNYNYQLYALPGIMEYEAYRTKLNIAKLYSKHALNFTIDYGIGKIIDTDRSFHSTRLLLNYRTGPFYIDGMASINPSNVYDVIMARDNDRFRNYSLTTGYNLNSPGSKLSGNAYIGYNYINTYKSRNYFSSALLSYKIGSDWYATGNVTYSSFQNNRSSSGFNNFQFSIGLKKAFTRWSSATGDENNIILEVFEDHDQNGRRNGKEPLLPGTIVQLNKTTVAITDSKGSIKLNQVPAATYYITAQRNDQRLDILTGDSILIENNGTIAIPVIKTYIRNGSLREIKAEYDIQVQDASGITIYAQNTQTGKTYHTVTSFEGDFQLKLPAGHYLIQIRNDRYEITNNNQEITVGNLNQDTPLIFHYKNKDIRIDVKQF
ncbi:carboxypeptidase-like regulatory domain-containing protein [Niabella yanshanensis]|uniref:Carboxypeptidase-like regulatory domain-containing protein n=1 Tax=Niabella yanshanensis TaxID=577386 RepID=A0ABZ0W9U6_9BACT|nr:carboxypeptidase-like regulatory domain-containing protein [Niabella yanshanensis]WQD39916.1 carboxypeptidase-like regulatory domain-containing protein [Niabella yanshanensis]